MILIVTCCWHSQYGALWGSGQAMAIPEQMGKISVVSDWPTFVGSHTGLLCNSKCSVYRYIFFLEYRMKLMHLRVCLCAHVCVLFIVWYASTQKMSLTLTQSHYENTPFQIIENFTTNN